MSNLHPWKKIYPFLKLIANYNCKKNFAATEIKYKQLTISIEDMEYSRLAPQGSILTFGITCPVGQVAMQIHLSPHNAIIVLASK